MDEEDDDGDRDGDGDGDGDGDDNDDNDNGGDDVNKQNAGTKNQGVEHGGGSLPLPLVSAPTARAVSQSPQLTPAPYPGVSTSSLSPPSRPPLHPRHFSSLLKYYNY